MRVATQRDEHADPVDNVPPEPSNNVTESLSPLAMAAADWIDDGYEEDELAKYWERFDDAKSEGRRSDTTASETESSLSKTAGSQPLPRSSENLTTDELLDQYHAGRGIDRNMESRHRKSIEKALEAAGRSSSAGEAVRLLEGVQPYLQPNTRVGGGALLELAQAYDADGDDKRALDIYVTLRSNPHSDVKRRVRQLLKDRASGRRKKFGNDVWNLWDSSTWWT